MLVRDVRGVVSIPFGRSSWGTASEICRFDEKPIWLSPWARAHGPTIATTAVMARKITFVCGCRLVGWQLIYQVAWSVQSSGMLGTYQVDPHAPGISGTIVIGRLKIAHGLANNGDWTLLELLRLTRKYNATDERDKVFALHGVVTNLSSISAAVDYSKSWEEVYTDVTVHELMQKRTLSILADAGICTYSKNPELPLLGSRLVS